MTRSAKLRLGATALLLSAVITLTGLLLRGPLIIDTSDAQAFAEAVVSSNNLIAETFLPLSLVIQLFGFLGIYLYLESASLLANSRTAVLNFWAMVLSVLGNGLFLPFAGVFAFAMPVVGKLYLAGNTDVIDVARQTLGPGTGFAYLIASAFALTIGAVLFAIAMWKSQTIPHWIPIIYVAQAFCLSFGASLGFGFEVTGGVMLFAFSIVLGIKMWKPSF